MCRQDNQLVLLAWLKNSGQGFHPMIIETPWDWQEGSSQMIGLEMPNIQYVQAPDDHVEDPEG